jgi:hypothetical protein
VVSSLSIVFSRLNLSLSSAALSQLIAARGYIIFIPSPIPPIPTIDFSQLRESSPKAYTSAAQIETISLNPPRNYTMAPVATTLAGESDGNAQAGALGMTTSGKKLKIRSYPQFSSLEEERLYRKQHLAAAFRMYVNR